jgi:hypothetical protein
VASAGSKRLVAGPRGGGRDTAKIRAHVTEGHHVYLRAVGGSPVELATVRDAFEEALRARAAGLLPERGPRGGARWSARYALRRAAWHILDHAWEIEDRLP